MHISCDNNVMTDFCNKRHLVLISHFLIYISLFFSLKGFSYHNEKFIFRANMSIAFVCLSKFVLSSSSSSSSFPSSFS